MSCALSAEEWRESSEWSQQSAPTANAPAITGSQSAYTVRKDDTLWDLAMRFLRNPFSWNKIWNANPQIRNPNLVYPGQEIAIPGENGTALQSSTINYSSSTSEPQQLAYQDSSTNTSFADAVPQTATTPPARSSSPLEDYTAHQLAKDLSAKGFFSPSFLANVGYIWFDKDYKGVVLPGNGILDVCKDPQVFRQFDKVSASLFPDANYTVGQYAEIVHADGFVKYREITANIVRPIARIRIDAKYGSSVDGTIISQSDVIRCKDRITLAEPIPVRIIASIDNAGSEKAARVFMRIETTEGPYLYQTFIIDQGANNGIAIGDVFAVYPCENDIPSSFASMVAVAARVQNETSSLVIIKMFSNTLKPNDSVVRIKHVRFK